MRFWLAFVPRIQKHTFCKRCVFCLVAIPGPSQPSPAGGFCVFGWLLCQESKNTRLGCLVAIPGPSQGHSRALSCNFPQSPTSGAFSRNLPQSPAISRRIGASGGALGGYVCRSLAPGILPHSPAFSRILPHSPAFSHILLQSPAISRILLHSPAISRNFPPHRRFGWRLGLSGGAFR